MNQANQIAAEQEIIGQYLEQIKTAPEHNKGRLIDEYSCFLNATYRRLQVAGDLVYAEQLARAIQTKAKTELTQNGGVE